MFFAFEEFAFDAQRLELRRGDQRIEADAISLRMLALLLRNAGRLVSKEELVQEVWQGCAVGDNVISVVMARLRKLLGDRRGQHELVKTVYGRGYRFVGATREASAFATTRPPPAATASASPFVGREAILAQLQQAHAAALRGRGRMCALLGEPGIGKTYAVEAFVRGLPSETRTVWGFCRESGDAPPLFPWLRVLRELLAGPSQESPDQPEPALRSLLRDPMAGAGGGAAAEQAWVQRHQRQLAYEAISRLLATTAQSAPLVLVLEDLHCADAASLELLMHLLDELALQRILLIVTLRHNQAPAREAVRARLASALGHRNCERVPLQRLREPEVRAYVSALLHEGEESLARAVFDKSEGNPFYMAELCRQLRDREPHERKVLSMSDAALDLVRQHVARLDAEARGVLSAAAMIGSSFELALLRAVTGRTLSALMASLDSALAAEVVIAAPDSPTAFAFGHELYRAVLNDALAPAERRDWHARLADALDQRARAGKSIAASEVAHHLYASLPASDPEKVIHYCRLAADAAAASYAGDEVVRHMRHALSALDLMKSPSVALRMQFVQLIAIYARGSSAAEYESAARELARLARLTADAAMLVRAGMMFNLHPGFKQLAGVSDELSYALTLLTDRDMGLRAAALAGIAVSSPTCFSAERAGRLLDEAVPLARTAASAPAQYAALICALQLRGGPRHSHDANAMLAELDTLAQSNPLRMPVLPVDLSLYRCVTALQRGELSAARQFAHGAAAQARRIHHDELAWHADRFGALLTLEQEPSHAARQALERLHQRADDPGLFGLEAFRSFDRAIWLAEFDPTLQLDTAELHALRYDSSDPPSLWSIKIRALARVGAHADAQMALHALTTQQLGELPCDRDLLGTLGHVVRAALLVGANDYAKQAAECLAPYRDSYAAHVGFLCEGSIPHLLGAVALALGDVERAVVELEQGLARDEQAGLSRSAGEARLALARALQRREQPGDSERAHALLADVAKRAEALGLLRLAREARAAQAR
jgi:DNA-binding winged helix-turn-helix (wHTH) protein